MRQFLRRSLQQISAEGGSVKARVFRSGFWTGLAQLVVAATGFVRSVILARLLTPEMFGLMGLCLVVVQAVETFTRPGLGQAMIQRQKPFEESADTAFIMFLVRGVVLTVLMVVTSPLIASFYEDDRLTAMLQVLSFAFLIGGAANIYWFAYQKKIEFKRITYLNLIVTIASTVVTILLAYSLRNVWALVVGHMVGLIFHVLLSYIVIKGSIKFRFDWGIAKELLAYGKFVTASSIVIFLATEVDTIVIGKVLGPEQLGYYVIAFVIANLVTANISKVISAVMLPAYSELQANIPALREAYLRTTLLVMLITLPACVGLFVVAEQAVLVLYGEKWAQSVLPLQILMVFGLFRALASVDGYLFNGIGHPGVTFYSGLVRLIVVVAMAVPAVMEFGLSGIAVVVTIGMFVQWAIGISQIRKYLELSFLGYLRTIAGPVWKSLVMGGVVLLTARAVAGDSILGLSALVLVGAVLYMALTYKTFIALKN